MNSSRQRFCGSVPGLLASLMLPILAVFPAAAAGTCDGNVSTVPFLELAGETDLTVEVSLKGALLRLLSSVFASQDPEMAEMVGQLEAIQAVIVDISDPAKYERGVGLMKQTLRKLNLAGWERLARVQEDDVNLSVLINSTDESICGLVVLLHEKSDDQLIIVNIAGLIDLAKLEALGRQLDLPGLDQVPKKRD